MGSWGRRNQGLFKRKLVERKAYRVAVKRRLEHGDGDARFERWDREHRGRK